jgi:hypothetical protein
MSTFAALVTKPFDRLLDIQAALPFLQNHFTPASRRMPSSKHSHPIARSCTPTRRSTITVVSRHAFSVRLPTRSSPALKA